MFCDHIAIAGRVAVKNLAHARRTQHVLVTLQSTVLAVPLDTFSSTVSGATLQYDGTIQNSSPPSVMLTVGRRETVYCVQLVGPVLDAIEWYNPQGQVVLRDNQAEVNQAGASRGRAALLNFERYQQSQGGKYGCRVTGPGNYLEKLPVCIGECCTFGGCIYVCIYI